MKKFFADFRKFISRGNILDMAVGVIVGAAFSKIVTSLVNDVLMPLIAMAFGGKSLSGLVVVLNGQPLHLADGTLNPAALTWNYGNFIQTIIDFLIVAFCLFLVLKLIMKSSEMFRNTEKILNKNRLNREDKKELKARGIKTSNKEAVKFYQEEKEQKLAAEKKLAEEKKKAEELEKLQNSPEYVLKEIRDLLKEQNAPDTNNKA